MAARGSNIPRPAAKDLIGHLRASGMSMRDIATECDRDPSLLYQVASGKRSGANLTDTLTQLIRGKVTTRPPRRTTSTGTPAKVRGTRGAPAAPPPPPSPTKLRRGHFGETSIYLAGNSTQRQISIPKSKRSKGRKQAKEQAKIRIAEAARDKRRIAFKIHHEDGTSRTIGGHSGYGAGTIWKNLDSDPSFSDDPVAWLENELTKIDEARNSALGDSPKSGVIQPIVGIDITVFGDDRSRVRAPSGVRGYLSDVHRTRQDEAHQAMATAVAQGGTPATKKKRRAKKKPTKRPEQHPLF